MKINELTEALLKKCEPRELTTEEKLYQSVNNSLKSRKSLKESKRTLKNKPINEAYFAEYVCTLEFESEEARDTALNDALRAGLGDDYDIELGDEPITLYVTSMSTSNKSTVLTEIEAAFDSITDESIIDIFIDETGFSLNESTIHDNEITLGNYTFKYSGREGWVVKSNKLNKEYTLGELKSLQGTTTTDIVVIFDYDTMDIVDFFFGAGDGLDEDMAQHVVTAIAKYEGAHSKYF